MRRRGVTVLVGAALLILLVWQIAIVRVPYVELSPGLTVDTLGAVNGKPVITIEGAPASRSEGQLRLTTVEVLPDLSLLEALRGWVLDDYAVVPRELIYPPDRPQDEVRREDEEVFRRSQSTAETAALRELGFPVEVTVTEVAEGFPATGVLQPEDVVTAVDGESVTSSVKLTQLVRAKPAGTERQVTYRRAGESRTVALTTKEGEDGNPRLGITVDLRQPHPFTVKIELDRIGGPSAGLMFALGIIDTVKPEDLTGGVVIAGTGTIDEEGTVGPIGGVPQKILGAKAAKAKFFFTPAANCAEAVRNAQPGLPLVKVGTLREALDALQAIRDKRTPTLCPR